MPMSNPSLRANSPIVGGFGVGVNVGVFIDVGNGVNDGVFVGVGNGVNVGVAVGPISFVASTPQAERASPAEATPATLRKSLRVIIFFSFFTTPLFQLPND